MRTRFGIGVAILAAAGMAAPAMFAQQPAPPAPPPPPRAPRATHAQTRIYTAQNASYLGIGVQDIDAERAKALKLKEDRGAEVTNVVPDSPAAKAGFKDGDVVLEYNGEKVEGQEQLARMVRETPAGRQVQVVVWRNGSNVTLTPTIEAGKGPTVIQGGGEWPFNMRMPAMPPMPAMPDMPQIYMGTRSAMLGIEGESLDQQHQFAEFFGVKDGVLVRSVIPNSAAEKAGIKAGDVITRVDNTNVTTPRDITRALRDLRGKTNITVTVVRNKKEMQIPVTIEAGENPARAMMFSNPVREIILNRDF
jgi:serine protease Do